MMIQLMGSITKEIKKLLKKFKSKPMKGAADVAAIVILLVSLIVFIAVLPALNETIAIGLGYTDSMTSILLRLIPFMMVLLMLLIPTN